MLKKSYPKIMNNTLYRIDYVKFSIIDDIMDCFDLPLFLRSHYFFYCFLLLLSFIMFFFYLFVFFGIFKIDLYFVVYLLFFYYIMLPYIWINIWHDWRITTCHLYILSSWILSEIHDLVENLLKCWYIVVLCISLNGLTKWK